MNCIYDDIKIGFGYYKNTLSGSIFSNERISFCLLLTVLSQIQLKVVDTVRACGFHVFPVVRAGGRHQHTVWLRRSTQRGWYPDLYLRSSSPRLRCICSAFSVVTPLRTCL